MLQIRFQPIDPQSLFFWLVFGIDQLDKLVQKDLGIRQLQSSKRILRGKLDDCQFNLRQMLALIRPTCHTYLTEIRRYTQSSKNSDWQQLCVLFTVLRVLLIL